MLYLQNLLKSSQIINRLKPEEEKIVNSLITGDIDSIANKEYVGFSNEARKIIKEAGQEMVDAGLLSPSVYQKCRHLSS